jgi:hypothetical protein
MTVPPLLVNGGNASIGGAGNYISELFITEQAEDEEEDGEEENEDDAGEESDLEEFSRGVFADGKEADCGCAEGEVESNKGSEGNEGSEGSEAIPAQQIFHNGSEDGLFDDDDDDDEEEGEDEHEEPELKKRRVTQPAAPEVHPPEQVHQKYRPGRQRQQRPPVKKGSTPTSATDSLAEALRLEGVADRKAAKCAQTAAYAEASKARKHERAMMAMMMQAFMKK